MEGKQGGGVLKRNWEMKVLEAKCCEWNYSDEEDDVCCEKMTSIHIHSYQPPPPPKKTV